MQIGGGESRRPDRVVEQLSQALSKTTMVDRREAPSHGYRAVHIVADCNGKPVEIQVRTALQHMWTKMSEKFADVVEPAIKYGGGPEQIRTLLSKSSALVAKLEWAEREFSTNLADVATGVPVPGEIEKRVAKIRENLRNQREGIAALLQDANALVQNGK